MKTLRTLLFALAAAAPPVFAQEAQTSPHADGHQADGHHAGVDARGDQVMGFDHAKTTHHFLLTASGGAIDVSANDPTDTASRDAIRSHLEHIAKMFAAGNFEAPMLIHGRVPPGVPEMKRDGKQIAWSYEPTPAGGRVVATTKNSADLSAIHDFLRFQIEDHRTGDPTDAPKP